MSNVVQNVVERIFSPATSSEPVEYDSPPETKSEADEVSIDSQTISPEESTQEENAEVIISAEGHENDKAATTAPDVEPVITSPEEIPVESFQKHTAVLHDVSKSEHVKIYDRAAAFIDLQPEKYTEDNLILGTQLTKEFMGTRVMVRTCAVGLATQYKINEGRLMGKVLDIHDAIIGTGREEYADKMFQYPKSTRCMYIRISSIEGVDPYTFLGTEFLRKVATAIEKTGVDGPDQIAALFAEYGEECDTSLSHKDFKNKLNSILELVLATEKANGLEVSPASDDGEDDPTTPEAPSASGDGEDDPTASEVSPASDDGEDDPTASEVPPASDDGEDDPTASEVSPASGDGEDAPATPEAPPKGKESEKEAKHKRFLNQESVNITLTNFIKSVDKLLKENPPKYKLDMIKFGEARTCLDKLEAYVKGESAE